MPHLFVPDVRSGLADLYCQAPTAEPTAGNFDADLARAARRLDPEAGNPGLERNQIGTKQPGRTADADVHGIVEDRQDVAKLVERANDEARRVLFACPQLRIVGDELARELVKANLCASFQAGQDRFVRRRNKVLNYESQ